MDKELKIGLYARTSTRGQNLETQLLSLRRHCEINGYKEHVEEYNDEGVSGRGDSRPEFNRLLADIRASKINCVVVYKLDRIGRSLPHLLKLFQEFRKRKVKFISLTQNIDTGTPEGKLFLRMLMVLAEYERELIISRINDGLDRARANGKKLGRPSGAKDRKRRRRAGYINRWLKTKKVEANLII